MATARERVLQKLAPSLNLIPKDVAVARKKFKLTDVHGNAVEIVAGGEPVAHRLLLTPELASFFLNNVTPTQRDIKSGVASRYAADIQAGAWKFTVEALGFDEHLELCEGQHRCVAVAMTGMSIQVWAIFNQPHDSFTCVDIGATRSVTDMAAFMGKEASNQRVAIANHMRMGFSMWKQGNSKPSLMDFMERHSAALDFVCARATTSKGVGQAAVQAPIARAWYSQSHERLEEFMEILKTNVPRDAQADQAALTLLKWLLEQPKGSGGNVKQMVYAKTSRALEAFCVYKPLSKLYAAEAEIFLLPEEKKVE